MSKTPPGTRLMSELPPRERFIVQHWRLIGVCTVLVLILAAGVIIALLRVGQANDRADGAAKQVASLQTSVQALTTAGAQNQSKLKTNHLTPVGPPIASISAGKATPVATENAPVTPAPTYTQVVPVKPTQEQVTHGVDAYFDAHPPTFPFSTNTVITRLVPYVTAYLKAHPAKDGTNGAPGASGSPGLTGPAGPRPTDDQINVAVQTFLPAAVANYLTANPAPSGPPGSPGAQGSPGVDGTNGTNGSDGATGPQGPGPTEQQIADAVSAYFADHPLACKDGYTATDETVTTTNGPVLVQVCVADNQPTATPTDAPTVPTDTATP